MYSMGELLDYAGERGVKVEWVRMRRGFAGAASALTGTVYLDWGLESRPRHAISVLAHELGHVALGHDCAQNADGEEAANRWAARMLISPAEYAVAECLYGTNPSVLAVELGVTRSIVKAWQARPGSHLDLSPLGMTRNQT